MENIHNLINIGPTHPIEILNQHEIFWRFFMCAMIFLTKIKILEVGIGAQQQRQEVY